VGRAVVAAGRTVAMRRASSPRRLHTQDMVSFGLSDPSVPLNFCLTCKAVVARGSWYPCHFGALGCGVCSSVDFPSLYRLSSPHVVSALPASCT
jgi:hypothetical protein